MKHGGPRPGAGHPLKNPAGPRIRRTIYIDPATNHALEALANPGERLGDTIDRIIRTRELYPAFTKTKPTLYEVLEHHWGAEEAAKWAPPAIVSDILEADLQRTREQRRIDGHLQPENVIDGVCHCTGCDIPF